jgi:RNA polymerase sigma-70 factor (ECF subfamily)
VATGILSKLRKPAVKNARDTIEGTLEELRPRIHRLSQRILRHPEDAEDAAQHVLLKVAERLRHFPAKGLSEAWLYRVTLTTSLEQRRKYLRRSKHEGNLDLASTTPPGEPDPISDSLHQAIAGLDDELRTLVVDHYFEKKTLDELARSGRCSTVAVWKKILKAREKLKEALKRAGHGAAIPAHGLDWILRAEAPGPIRSALQTKAILGGTAMAGKYGVLGYTLTASFVFLVLGTTVGIVIEKKRGSKEEAALRERLHETDATENRLARGLGEFREREEKSSSSGAAAQTAAPAPPSQSLPLAASGATSALRGKLRKYVRMALAYQKDDKAARPDPEAAAEATAFLSEIYPILQFPSKFPEKHAEVCQALYEILPEEVGKPLTDDQKSGLSSVLGAVRSSLTLARGEASPERRVLELKATRRMVEGLLEILSPAQVEAIPSTVLGGQELQMGGARPVRKDSAAADIVRAWTETYNLEDYQGAAASAAARTLVESIDRLTRRFLSAHGYSAAWEAVLPKPGDGLRLSLDRFDHRIECASAQRDALKALEGALSAEQLKLVRSKIMSEFIILSPEDESQVDK